MWHNLKPAHDMIDPRIKTVTDASEPDLRAMARDVKANVAERSLAVRMTDIGGGALVRLPTSVQTEDQDFTNADAKLVGMRAVFGRIVLHQARGRILSLVNILVKEDTITLLGSTPTPGAEANLLVTSTGVD